MLKISASVAEVCAEMHCGSFPFQKLSVNNTISKELTWLANHVEKSNSVHIIQSQE